MRIAVIGLGYVGLPLAVEFAKHYKVTGIDIDMRKVDTINAMIDPTTDEHSQELEETTATFNCTFFSVDQADIVIIAVPTPVDHAMKPDFRPLLAATSTVAPLLKRGAIVVYESTVYPGATTSICAPLLQKYCGHGDFRVGYSPERIVPGDSVHGLANTVKLVAGDDARTTDKLAEVYGKITTVHKCSSIEVAEAAKVFENTQRDANIALVNEAAQLFKALGIPTADVLTAVGTKWNALNFKPGLVGGHCIGVDPYYLADLAAQNGLESKMIQAARATNEQMPRYFATQIVKAMCNYGIMTPLSSIIVLGITFKPDVSDIRNSKVATLVSELTEYGINVQVCDPLANEHQVKDEYGIKLVQFSNLVPADAVVMAVPHEEFKTTALHSYTALVNGQGMFFELNPFFNEQAVIKSGYQLWRL